MTEPNQKRKFSGHNQVMPFKEFPNWLAEDEAADVLRFIQDNEDNFVTGSVYVQGEAKFDTDIRNALQLRDLGPYRAFFERKALSVQSELEQAFGIAPFKASRAEVDFLAYGDNAHFQSHIDTLIHINRDHPRVISLIVYLQNTPARYTGGELHFHALMGKDVKIVVPEHNLMVAFPAISPHSVAKISCPSGNFSDYRFAVVMWIHS